VREDVAVPTREATPDDVLDIGRVHALSRRAAYAGLLPDRALARITTESQAAVWRDRLAEAVQPSVLLLHEHDGRVGGFAHADGHAVIAALHGTGAGQQLHDALVERFRQWGCVSAGLWVLRGNERAQAFYRRNGWTHDGTTGTHEIGGSVVPILRYRLTVPPASPATAG
jgi:GNAT superfamily N-acetyltransferase